MHPCRLRGCKELQIPIPARVTQPASMSQGDEPE